MQAEWRKQEEKAKAYEQERRVSLKRAKEARKTQITAGETGISSGMLERMRELSRGSLPATPDSMAASSEIPGRVHTPPAPRAGR